MQPCVVLMHGPSFGSCAAERNGAAAPGGSETAAPGAVAVAGWLSAAVGTWVQPAAPSIATTRPVTYPRLRMVVECRTCSQSGNRSGPEGREYDLVHIPSLNCFALPETIVLKERSRRPHPGRKET